MTAGSGPAPQYTLDANNRLVGFSYDAAGNLLNDAFHSYTYDAEGQVITVDGSGATYVYDSSGLRVQSVVGTNTVDFIYDQQVHAITEVTPGWARSELYAGGTHVASYFSWATFFDHSDWLGTVRALSMVSGAVYADCGSLAFGDGQSCPGSPWYPPS